MAARLNHVDTRLKGIGRAGSEGGGIRGILDPDFGLMICRTVQTLLGKKKLDDRGDPFSDGRGLVISSQ